MLSADLMIYALVAAGLVFWLRSILGTRHGDERDRSPANMAQDAEGKVVSIMGGADSQDQSAKAITMIEELAEEEKGNMSVSGKNTVLSLIDIAKADKSFDIHVFLQAAQDAFAYIVESFAEGDRETLKDLLGEEVYRAFDTAITAREKAGETMVSEIHAVQKSEIIDAGLDGKMASITVRLWADETSVTRDEDGNILHGHPEKTVLMRDVWTFSRDLKSRDPRWLVIETREDGTDDNETIPNTH